MATKAKKRTSGKKEQNKRPPKRSYRQLGLIGLAALVLVIGAIWASTRQSAKVATTVAETEIAYEGITTAWINGKTLGNPDAPVTIQLWEDFM